jgi:hypothetical protein
MGCNCKKKAQVLNNLESNDHLQIAFDVYMDVVNKKSLDELDDLDKKQINFAFYSIYPNVKTEVSLEHAVSTIKNIYTQYYGRKK